VLPDFLVLGFNLVIYCTLRFEGNIIGKGGIFCRIRFRNTEWQRNSNYVSLFFDKGLCEA
jgi:hypothetical protein